MIRSAISVLAAEIAPCRVITGRSAENLPYSVVKTVNGEYPVFKEYRNRGLEVNTVVRHVAGNIFELQKDLSLLCETQTRVLRGKIVVRGVHTWKIKEYFESVGL